MAPLPDAKTFFNNKGGRGQPESSDLRELVDKANKSGKERTGVNGILLGPALGKERRFVNYVSKLLNIFKSKLVQQQAVHDKSNENA